MQQLAKLRGQGLIEALVTLLILAAVSIALIRFQANLAYGNSVSQQMANASNLAVKQIENLRDYTALTGTPSYQSIVSGSSTTTLTDTLYTITWTVTSFTNPTYKTLDVTVSWTDRNSVARSVRLVTRVAAVDPSTSGLII